MSKRNNFRAFSSSPFEDAPLTDPRRQSREISEALADLGSVVYAVPVHGMVKIGYTTDLRNRMSCYGAKLTDLLLVLPGGRDEEAALHLRFAADLMRGREWFRQSAQILEWVNAERSRLGTPPATWPRETEDLALLTALSEAEHDLYA